MEKVFSGYALFFVLFLTGSTIGGCFPTVEEVHLQLYTVFNYDSNLIEFNVKCTSSGSHSWYCSFCFSWTQLTRFKRIGEHWWPPYFMQTYLNRVMNQINLAQNMWVPNPMFFFLSSNSERCICRHDYDFHDQIRWQLAVHGWIPPDDGSTEYYGLEATMDVYGFNLEHGQQTGGFIWIYNSDETPAANVIHAGWNVSWTLSPCFWITFSSLLL